MPAIEASKLIPPSGEHEYLRRQAGPADDESPSYDRRWLLFLIPLILAFLAIIAVVWYCISKRNKRRQRRSSLRNVTLVAADEEKRQERLSRNNSQSSRFGRVSRMTSIKSTKSAKSARSAVERRAEQSSSHPSQTERVEGNGEKNPARLEHDVPIPESTSDPQAVKNEITSVDCAFEVSPVYQPVALPGVRLDNANEKEAAQADNEDADTSTDAGHRVRVRSGISVIGDLPSFPDSEHASAQAERIERYRKRSSSQTQNCLPSALKKDNTDLQRQSSVRSTTGSVPRRQSSLRSNDGSVPQRHSSLRSNDGTRSSITHSSLDHTGNPFLTPSTSQAEHAPNPYNSNNGVEIIADYRLSTDTAKPARDTNSTPRLEATAKLSDADIAEIQTLRPPQPARTKSSRAVLQRNDSRSSSRSSKKVTWRPWVQGEDIKRAPSAPAIDTGLSQGLGAPGDGWRYTSRAHEWRSSSASPSQGIADNPASLSSSSLVHDRDAPASSAPSRRASVGVAGSRFVETFE